VLAHRIGVDEPLSRDGIRFSISEYCEKGVSLGIFPAFSANPGVQLDPLTSRVTGLVSFLRGRSEQLMLALPLDDKQLCETDHDVLFTEIR
jgi:hypothetical protein